MKRPVLVICCLVTLVLAAALVQFVSSSPIATATIGTETVPKTALHLPSGRQLYPLRLSARIAADYQGDASLHLIGDLPAELTLVNIGPVLHPLDTRSYSLNKAQILNLKAGEQIDLLVVLRSPGTPLALDPEQAALIPACCQIPPGQAADGTYKPVEPALVLVDTDKLQKLWTIPLRISVQAPKT